MAHVILASDMGLGTAAVTAIFGYCVVFCGLLLLMLVLYAMGAVFRAKEKKEAAKQAAAKAAAPATPVEEAAVEKPLAPGSAGKVKRFDVPDKEAAMVMAVVAHQMQKPLNQLRFISIKEVKEDEV